MKISRRIFCFCLILFLLSAGFCFAESEPKHVNIIATHDIHSHLAGFQYLRDGEVVYEGGLARLSTLIKQQREKDPELLLVDAGDFSMGTLYQALYESHALELSLLSYMGYDAVTFGNHEFDYGSDGLANMLHAAMESGYKTPALVECNIDFTACTGDGELIRDAFADFGGSDYTMIEKNGVNIAVLGVFGKSSLEDTPTSEVGFTDQIEAVQRTVAAIKANEDADMIVCISHSGTDSDPDKSEDELLAKAVPELDVIVSGHTHTVLSEPIIVGETCIVSFGEYAENAGLLSLTQKDNGRWNPDTYEVKRLGTDIEEDPDITAVLEEYAALIDEEYLSRFGYETDQVLAVNNVKFATVDDSYGLHEENNLGEYIADAFMYAVPEFTDGEIVPDVAIAPAGVIRDTMYLGDVTTADVFNMYSLGKGFDGVVGYPLLAVYVTASELRTIAEIDASLSDFLTYARLHTSGLGFAFDPHRLILNKVNDLYIEKDGIKQEPEKDKLYCIVSDLYSARMLAAVKSFSKGLIRIDLKHADGSLVEDLADAAITVDGEELKAWAAIADYTASFGGTIPEEYAEPLGRKVVDNSWNIGHLLRNPSQYVWMILGLLLIVALIIAFIVQVSKQLIRRARRTSGGSSSRKKGSAASRR